MEVGSLLQVRGHGKFSPWIRLCCGGVHTHSMLYTYYNEVSEVKELIGGRITSLDDQYEWYEGCIDVFTVRREFYDSDKLWQVCCAMRRMAMYAGYNYMNIVNIALRHLPGFHLLFDDGVYDDRTECLKKKRLHCSEAVSAAFQWGLIDPCPETPNALVTPHMLTTSLLFEYSFSL